MLATPVVIPAAWYMLRFFQDMTEGPLVTAGSVAAAVAKRRTGAASGDLRVGEALVLLPLILLIFYLGVQPAILTTRMETTVTGILTAANAADRGRHSAHARRGESGDDGGVHHEDAEDAEGRTSPLSSQWGTPAPSGGPQPLSHGERGAGWSGGDDLTLVAGGDR